jgi:hypothetical protein
VSFFGNRQGRQRQQQIRGMLTFSLRNSATDARPFSLTGQDIPQAAYANSRIGFSVGGPLIIPKLIHSEKTFFFVNFFETRSRQGQSSYSTLPSLLERGGNFSQSIAQGAVTIYDPVSGLPFPGNVIPASRIDPAARGLLSFIPTPNLPGQVQNYNYTTSSPSNTYNLNTRFNQSLPKRNQISAGFSLQSRSSQSPQLYGFKDAADGRGLGLNLGWTHNFTPRLLNSLRYSFSRNRNSTVPFFANTTDVAAHLGILGTSRDPANFGPPNFSFTNFGGLSDASSLLRVSQASVVNDGITLVHGTHTFTFGGEFRRTQTNTLTDQNARGTFAFSGLSTSAFNAQGQPLSGTGFDFADFLLGAPQSASVRFGSSSTYFRGSTYSTYAQDDWRLRSNLSLNLGLRYEFTAPLTEKYGHIANLDIAPGFTGVAPVTAGATGPYTGAFPNALIDPDHRAVSPRVGLAWRPFPKHHTIVRSGYGVYFNGSIYGQIANQLAAQPPFASTATFNTSTARPLTIEDAFTTPGQVAITNTYAVDRGYRLGYAQTWSLAVQQELPHAFVAELGYLGTKGTRLDVLRLPNRAAPGSPLTAEQRRQIGNAVGFTFDSSPGNSIYHAGQARLTRRFRRGISLNALYTYAKSIDNSSTFGGAGNTVAQDDKDLRAERGLSSFDQRHSLNLTYMFTSPTGGRGATMRLHGWAARLVEDWNMSGGMTYGSGTPLTARVLGNQSDAGGTGSIGSGRADSTGAPLTSSAGFFNLAAFAIPPSGRYGDAGRNTISGPSLWSLNLALGRSFRLGDDRRRLELRMESTNVTNHVNFVGVNTVVNASNYGFATAAGAMRTTTANLRFRF